jgi:hypothetical protein
MVGPVCFIRSSAPRIWTGVMTRTLGDWVKSIRNASLMAAASNVSPAWSVKRLTTIRSRGARGPPSSDGLFDGRRTNTPAPTIDVARTAALAATTAMRLRFRNLPTR